MATEGRRMFVQICQFSVTNISESGYPRLIDCTLHTAELLKYILWTVCILKNGAQELKVEVQQASLPAFVHLFGHGDEHLLLKAKVYGSY